MALTLGVDGMDAALAALKRYGPKEIEADARRATMAGARVARDLIRPETPVGKTRRLRRSLRAKPGRGYAASVAGFGRGGQHRHLVIRGHRIVTRSGNDTGRRSKANPFVDRVVDERQSLIVEAVKRELFRK